MTNYALSKIYVYPIKSLGAIELEEATLTDTGIAYDRFWMLVDDDGKMITQREIPELAKFKVVFSDLGVEVAYLQNKITVPFKSDKKGEELTTVVWGNKICVQKKEDHINQWFSEVLGQKLFLVQRATNAKRYEKNQPNVEVNFPDSSQYLIFGQPAIELLNSKLDTPILANRFRANLIFEGGAPHDEDNWQEIQIGTAKFAITKSCARCKMTTINQETAKGGKEPLKILATYRFSKNKVWFGRYIKLIPGEGQSIKKGDRITVSC